MTDDAARIERLEAELAAARRRETSLVRDLAEAREQQAATAEILRVIAASPTDLDRVFNSLAEHAVRLCNSAGALVWRVEQDYLRLVALAGNVGGELQVGLTRPISAQFRPGRVVLERRVIQTDPEQAC